MNSPRSLALVLGLLAGGGAVVLVACSDGAAGATGAVGEAGSTGDAGATLAVASEAGAPVAASCFFPCHDSLTSGSAGVIAQWARTGHAHPAVPTVPTATGCGNCHADDALEKRLASTATDVTEGHLESRVGGVLASVPYAGTSPVAQTACTTCHEVTAGNDPHVTGRYVAGQTPVRIAGNVDRAVILEKTAGAAPAAAVGQRLAFTSGNVCIYCHKSPVDVAFAIATAGNDVPGPAWGPHRAPQADLYSGKGGYEFSGQTYGTATHAGLESGCVACHMGPLAANGGVPDHSLVPAFAFCQTCHGADANGTYDVHGVQTEVTAALAELELALDGLGLLTRSTVTPYPPLDAAARADGQFALDLARPATGLDAATAGALYDYLLVARGGDRGVHNPTYTRQLLWDAIRQVTGHDPASLAARP